MMTMTFTNILNLTSTKKFPKFNSLQNCM